jgi:hypothetical protein
METQISNNIFQNLFIGILSGFPGENTTIQNNVFNFNEYGVSQASINTIIISNVFSGNSNAIISDEVGQKNQVIPYKIISNNFSDNSYAIKTINLNQENIFEIKVSENKFVNNNLFFDSNTKIDIPKTNEILNSSIENLGLEITYENITQDKSTQNNTIQFGPSQHPTLSMLYTFILFFFVIFFVFFIVYNLFFLKYRKTLNWIKKLKKQKVEIIIIDKKLKDSGYPLDIIKKFHNFEKINLILFLILLISFFGIIIIIMFQFI